jgi:5S rRNA maturation endonuclease (ribonuclease M5)
MVSPEDSAVIESLSSFVKNLNDEEGALVIVEGVRDARALRNCGYSGKLFMLCHNSNFAKLVTKVSKYKKTILLLDNDSEGKNLSKRVQKTLAGKARTDLFYQRRLLPASRGRVRHVEELSTYAEGVARVV